MSQTNSKKIDTVVALKADTINKEPIRFAILHIVHRAVSMHLTPERVARISNYEIRYHDEHKLNKLLDVCVNSIVKQVIRKCIDE